MYRFYLSEKAINILLELGYFILFNNEKQQQSIQQLIVDILDENLEGLAVDQLYIQLNLIKSCSLASVYRILSEMRRSGVVRKTEFARQKAVYTMSKQKLKCSVSDAYSNEVLPCSNQELIMDFEQLFDKYKNEFSGIDIVLYKK